MSHLPQRLRKIIRGALSTLTRSFAQSTEVNREPVLLEKMTKLILVRSYTPQQTLGRMIVVNGVMDKIAYQCATVELPYKENKNNVSAIPEGEYPCHKIVSPNFGDAFAVENVPGRDLIRIHTANYTHQLRGCIAPGRSFVKMDDDNLWDVNYSRLTISTLYEHLPDNFRLKIISL